MSVNFITVPFSRLKAINPFIVGFGYILPTAMINILSLSVPIVILQIYDRIVPNKSFYTLKLLLLGALVAVIFESLFKIMRQRISLWQAARYEFKTYNDLFRKLLEAPLDKVLLRSTGELINEFNLVKYKKDLYGGGKLLIALIDIPFALIYLMLIFLIGGSLIWIPLIAIAFILLAMQLTRSTTLRLIEKKNQLDDRRFNFVNELFYGLHTIKTHAMEAQMLRRYEKLQDQQDVLTYNMMVSQYTLIDLFQLVNQMMLVLMVTFGAIGVIHHTMTLGIVAACVLLSTRSLQPLSKLISIWEEYQRVVDQVERYNVISRLPQYTDIFYKHNIHVQGRIEFRNVKVGFGKHEVLENVNLKFNPGEIIHISGASFSGKTVLLKLISGECLPTSGEVLIDGKLATQYPEASDKITYIGPDTTLFQGTIIENLNGFDGTHKIEKINLLLTKFGLNQFIQQLPKGLQTELTNQSVDLLPKGVKHRLILVRTMLQYPKIILFDEANINLDRTADEFIIKFLSSLEGKVTVFIISHRPSIKKIANKCYEIRDKQVVQANE